MADDVIHYTERVYTDADTGIATRTSDNALATRDGANGGEVSSDDQELADAFTWLNDLDICLERRDRQIRDLELKVAELSGAVAVLKSGKCLNVRGTFDENIEYRQFDVVAVGGSSFVATRDDPGPCPSTNGAWQLLASCGRRGARGFTGPRGERGEPGENAPAVAIPKMLHLDEKRYALTLIMDNGKPFSVDLRKLFEQFVADLQGRR
jgi:hypothetical protein